MYPMTPTETERLNLQIDESKMSEAEIIEKYIDAHETSHYLEGVNYYFSNSKITKRKIYTYDENGKKVVDHEATNNRLPSGWHKLLVDQKVAYLVGDPVTISSKSDNQEQLQKTNEVMGEQFDDVLPELVKAASNKGREWLHPYIDEDGEFDYITIPAEQVIPIYDNSKRKNLEGAIRYYYLDDDTMKIEFWDSEQVTYYEKVNGSVVLDALEEVNPAPHFFYGQDGYGWGKVPFIEFRNNEEVVSDLTFYKEQIDTYDLLMSDFANSLQDVQSLVYVLKGYDGTNLAEFMSNLKRYKAIKTDEQGGVDTKQADIPKEALDMELQRLIEDIYQFGQGVNTNTDKFGNSPSGIALKFLFSFLDMKASVLERKFSKGLETFVWFITEYLSISGQGDYDYKDIQFTFNKSMLMNEKEQADIAQLSKGVISDETIMANHPWVTDVEMEKERMEQQQSAYPNMEPPEDDEE